MSIHFFAIFTIIFLISSITYFVLHHTQYLRLKKINNFKNEVKNFSLILSINLLFILFVLPFSILTIVIYILILSGTLNGDYNSAKIFGDIYLGFAIFDYIANISFLIFLTISSNSTLIKIVENKLYFLDEIIYLDNIIGIEISKGIKKIVYNIDGEKEKKLFITKKVFLFLKSI